MKKQIEYLFFTLTIKIVSFIIIGLYLVSCTNSKISSFQHVENGIIISLEDGNLGIYPVADNAVRVKYMKDTLTALPELVFTQKIQLPEFTVEETSSKIKVIVERIQVIINKKSGDLSFADSKGNIFLNELSDSKKLIPGTIQGQRCYLAEQSFESPSDEHIFGLGQFQDGNYDLKGISRRLTQVNSQIALPFIYSDRGYGLLWHQYGMTDFNPTDNNIELLKQKQLDEENKIAEVTTTAGTQKVRQNQSLYTGTFSVAKEGKYSIFLDLGDMGNRHFVSIDGKNCIDQSNMWLPPTAGTLVKLSAGEHRVQLICKSDNKPKLSWKLTNNTTTFCSPVTKMLDYLVFYGPSADSVISTYRNLSGNAPLLPKWAYGFWQCCERYTSSNHLLETVKEFRKRSLPMDLIVQDWQYWGDNGWGVPKFDETNYPNPPKFIKQLHNLNSHFMVSIWSNPDKNSETGKMFVENKLFIPGTKWLDYYNPQTQKEYWNVLKNNMFDYGVDAWWMDAVEPENDALKGEMTYAGIGDFYRLTYPLMVSKAVYEGQRETTSEKRVCILTRSAFLGQQRYGVVNWSGDIGGDWNTYKRQIIAGLNFTITGLPYWTTDIGGFFRPGYSQYTDEKFHELLIRWYQWGAFNPVFRMHAYQTETEPWKYGHIVEENMRKMLNLRYRLLPYIYSEAWQVTHSGSTLMRPLVMDFREDTKAVSQLYEYMFGKAFLVAPIVESGIEECEVYLPQSVDWYNFWDEQRFKGGQIVKIDAALDKIPLFVKAGSIVPMGETEQYVGESSSEFLEIRIYEGANGKFTLYEDEGDNYNYESGAYSTIDFVWDDSKNILTISDQNGTYSEMLNQRKFNIIMIYGNNNGAENMAIKKFNKVIHYAGKKITIKL